MYELTFGLPPSQMLISLTLYDSEISVFPSVKLLLIVVGLTSSSDCRSSSGLDTIGLNKSNPILLGIGLELKSIIGVDSVDIFCKELGKSLGGELTEEYKWS